MSQIVFLICRRLAIQGWLIGLKSDKAYSNCLLAYQSTDYVHTNPVSLT